MTSAGTPAGVPWQGLEHALGNASDLPPLLAALPAARGRKLRHTVGELCDRVLHQGTIYSASPPVVQALIPIAASAGADGRALYYELLAEFASAAREAVSAGRATPCCSGGEPEHGRAILDSLLAAHDHFAPDLAHPDPAIRRFSGALLCCSAGASLEAARLVRGRYEIEPEAVVRLELLEALTRVRAHFPDWTGFLAAAVLRESDPDLCFALRYAQIREMTSAAGDAVAAGLLSAFLAADSLGSSSRFFEALHWLGPHRELALLLQALAGCADRDILRRIAEHLLRLVFDDRRTGWENTTYSIVPDGSAPQTGADFPRSMIKAVVKLALLALLWKIFPFLLRRRLRKSMAGQDRRPHKIEYWQITGEAPALPAHLNAAQQRTLAALAAKDALWLDQTNLWALFGLPANAAGLLALLAARS